MQEYFEDHPIIKEVKKKILEDIEWLFDMDNPKYKTQTENVMADIEAE